MAIIARDTITVTHVRDIIGTVWYYKLQASTAAPPAKPTTETPSGWTTTEPAYTDGSTNSLYTCEKTVFSDGTFEYSDVSLSSSYEAAKAAYNRAVSAGQAASTALGQVSEFITGTQTAATGAWKGTCSILSALKDGVQITYWLPFAYSSTGASSYTPTGGSAATGANLALTLADGTVTDPIPCFYNGTTRLTSHYGAGNALRLTYRENVKIGSVTVAKGWWADANYDTNTVYNVIPYFTAKTGAKGIWAASLFMRDGNGTYQNICTAADGTVTSGNRTTATTKKANTNGFEVGSPVYYSTSNYAANANISGSSVVYTSNTVFDSRYCLNTTLTAGSLTPYQAVYLTGEISPEDGLYYLDDVWWTQTPNDPEKVYVLIGGCYDSNTSNCRISLYETNNWLKYENGKLVDYTNNLAELALTKIEEEKTAREAAVAALQTALAAAGGMYETTEAVAGGGSIYYLHDKPAKADSTLLIKLTAEALGISVDGGTTWTSGFDFATQTAIMNILSANGINADWINAGAFVVKDSNGNILIDADAEHQQVRIGGLNVFPSALSGAVDACEIGLQNGKFQTWQTGNVLHYVSLEAAKLRFYYYQNGQQYDYGALQISDDGGSKYTVSTTGAITTTLFWDQVLNLLSKTLLTISGPVTFEETPAFEKNVLVLGNLYVRGGGSGTSSTNILTTLNNKAPTNHASTEQTYGITTASNYGHAKLVSGLLDLATQPTTAGCVTSAVQGWQLAQRTKMKTKSVSGSTNANGNLSLGLSSSSASVLGTSSTSTGTYLCVPFLNSSGDWYVRVLDASGNRVASTNIGSITVYYLATA